MHELLFFGPYKTQNTPTPPTHSTSLLTNTPPHSSSLLVPHNAAHHRAKGQLLIHVDEAVVSHVEVLVPFVLFVQLLCFVCLIVVAAEQQRLPLATS